MADGATVDPEQLNFIYATHRASGRAAGSFLGVVYDVDAFSLVVGVDGEGVWVKNANRSATITCTLMQSSISNDVYSGLHIADRSTPGGLMFPLFVQEKNGRSVYAAARARITKFADGTWSDGGEVRAWTFRTTTLRGFVGGIAATPLGTLENAATTPG